MSMPKTRLQELELVRAIAIIAVLIIHITAQGTVEIPLGSRSQIVYLVINKLSNFAVPVFVMISAMVLFYRYAGQWDGRMVLRFYAKRIKFIVIPYLLWAFFYYIFYQWLPSQTWAAVNLDWLRFADALRWGQTGYHLYFIILILQFYLLFPLWMTGVEKWPWFRRHFLKLAIGFQIAFYCYQLWAGPFERPATLFGTYTGLFAIGAAIGLNYESFRKSFHHIWWILLIAVLSGYTYALVFVLRQFSIDFGLIALEVLLNVYSLTIFMSLLWIAYRLLQDTPRFSRWLTSIGTAAFGIYFMHPAILSFCRTMWSVPGESAAYHGFTLVSGAAAFLIPWLLTVILKRWKGSWLILGK